MTITRGWDDDKIIGDRVRYVRDQILHYRISQFADRLRVAHRVVLDLETGRVVERQLIEAIAVEFGISASWLLSGIGEPKITKR